LNEKSIIPFPRRGGPGWGLIISATYLSLPQPLTLGGDFPFKHYLCKNPEFISAKKVKKPFTTLEYLFLTGLRR
jgi:hypothetical protein